MLCYSGLQEPRNDREFVGLYVSTYPRVGPYLMGFMAAYIGLALKKRNNKITHVCIKYTLRERRKVTLSLMLTF